ncbi:hypothetical protein [Faecalibacterium sp.]|uniref:hypothetical protein n=1 Tax=Faecalibacterium sp. TaxID=1971605 RepID=UPI00345CA35A
MGIGIQPTVALDEPDAIGSTPAQPVLTDEILVAADFVRVLCGLCLIIAFRQHLSKGAPHIAPSGFFSGDGPLDQIQIVLGRGIRIVRGVDIHSPDRLHHLCEILRGKACSEGGIYRRDKLCIRLFCCETAHQLFYKSVVIGKIRERQHIEHLCLFHSCRKTGGEHGILDGIHGIFHCLQLSLFLGRQIFNHHGLQAIRVDLDSAVKKADHGDDGHDDDYQHAEHDPADRLERFLVRQQCDGDFLEGCGYRCAHRPPALPNSAAL